MCRTPCSQPQTATLEIMDLKINLKPVFLALAGLAFALPAAAQWQWIDKDGHKVFSDRPPTADIKEKDILKQPGGKGRAPVSVIPTDVVEGVAAPVAKASAPASATAPKISGKDAELQARKKKLEDDAAAKKKADEDKYAQGLAENCVRARKGLASFQSGVRMTTVDATGERQILDDSARAFESKRLQGIIDSDCK